jgi:hypothetical protein
MASLFANVNIGTQNRPVILLAQSPGILKTTKRRFGNRTCFRPQMIRGGGGGSDISVGSIRKSEPQSPENPHTHIIPPAFNLFINILIQCSGRFHKLDKAPNFSIICPHPGQHTHIVPPPRDQNYTTATHIRFPQVSPDPQPYTRYSIKTRKYEIKEKINIYSQIAVYEYIYIYIYIYIYVCVCVCVCDRLCDLVVRLPGC